MRVDARSKETAPNPQRVFVGLDKVVWWTNAAWSLISIVRVFPIFEQQPREGRLLQDLVVDIIYVSAILSVVALEGGSAESHWARLSYLSSSMTTM